MITASRPLLVGRAVDRVNIRDSNETHTDQRRRKPHISNRNVMPSQVDPRSAYEEQKERQCE